MNFFKPLLGETVLSKRQRTPLGERFDVQFGFAAPVFADRRVCVVLVINQKQVENFVRVDG